MYAPGCQALVSGVVMQRNAPAPRAAINMKVALVYSTTTGNTETVAGYLTAATGIDAVDIADADDLSSYDGLICGAPTWHTDADTERSGTAWDEFLYGGLTGLDLSGKKVAVFGLGDQVDPSVCTLLACAHVATPSSACASIERKHARKRTHDAHRARRDLRSVAVVRHPILSCSAHCPC